jgi:hypothetical protein
MMFVAGKRKVLGHLHARPHPRVVKTWPETLGATADLQRRTLRQAALRRSLRKNGATSEPMVNKEARRTQRKRKERGRSNTEGWPRRGGCSSHGGRRCGPTRMTMFRRVWSPTAKTMEPITIKEAGLS